MKGQVIAPHNAKKSYLVFLEAQRRRKTKSSEVVIHGNLRLHDLKLIASLLPFHRSGAWT
jgi:hypothetical protein